METEILARVQFALTIAFHYIYPPLSIGLGLLMVVFKGIYLRTGKKEYEGHGMADVRACLQQCAHQRGLSGAGRRRDDENGAGVGRHGWMRMGPA